jgi:hypothetical protein
MSFIQSLSDHFYESTFSGPEGNLIAFAAGHEKIRDAPVTDYETDVKTGIPM